MVDGWVTLYRDEMVDGWVTLYRDEMVDGWVTLYRDEMVDGVTDQSEVWSERGLQGRPQSNMFNYLFMTHSFCKTKLSHMLSLAKAGGTPPHHTRGGQH